jgi:hypothetical protein
MSSRQGKSAADNEDDLEQFISPDIPTLIDNLSSFDGSTSYFYKSMDDAAGLDLQLVQWFHTHRMEGCSQKVKKKTLLILRETY